MHTVRTVDFLLLSFHSLRVYVCTISMYRAVREEEGRRGEGLTRTWMWQNNAIVINRQNVRMPVYRNFLQYDSYES